MGMNVGSDSGDDDVVNAINTTPLVDVMLVLLIIFMITIPVAIQTVPVKLPKEENRANETRPENINISVTRDGDVYWNMQLLPDHATLLSKLKTVAVMQPQPEIHIRGDQVSRWEYAGKVMVACQRAGIVKVGFITEPPPKG